MFIWNKDRTFCIKLKEVKSFGINKVKDNYEILAFMDNDPIHMGYFDNIEEARKAINDITINKKER